MSMTQVAIFNKDRLPNIKKIENDIQQLGYDFKFAESITNLLSNDGLQCSIDSHETYFETYIENPKNIVTEFDFIEPDIENEDAALSFV